MTTKDSLFFYGFYMNILIEWNMHYSYKSEISFIKNLHRINNIDITTYAIQHSDRSKHKIIKFYMHLFTANNVFSAFTKHRVVWRV